MTFDTSILNVDCVFVRNTVRKFTNSGYAGGGAALVADTRCNITNIRTNFTENTGPFWGGGILVNGSSSIYNEHCIFRYITSGYSLRHFMRKM